MYEKVLEKMNNLLEDNSSDENIPTIDESKLKKFIKQNPYPNILLEKYLRKFYPNETLSKEELNSKSVRIGLDFGHLRNAISEDIGITNDAELIYNLYTLASNLLNENKLTQAKGISKKGYKKDFKGCSLGKDKKGYFVYTHRARSRSYESPENISDKDINFIDSTG